MPESGHYPAAAPSGISKPSFVFAIGDVHGMLAKLRSLFRQCEAYAGNSPAKFVFLGDYIDRGPESSGVLAYLMELRSRLGDGVVTLKGNHEMMALAAHDDATAADVWISQGGAETLRSYGIADPRDLPAQHVAWMRSLRLNYDDGRRYFVHAGINPDKPLDQQEEREMLWIREPFLSDRRDHGRLIVHGHTPLRSATPDLRANRLNLDTGAVFGGPLSAAVFAARTEPMAFLQVE